MTNAISLEEDIMLATVAGPERLSDLLLDIMTGTRLPDGEKNQTPASIVLQLLRGEDLVAFRRKIEQAFAYGLDKWPLGALGAEHQGIIAATLLSHSSPSIASKVARKLAETSKRDAFFSPQNPYVDLLVECVLRHAGDADTKIAIVNIAKQEDWLRYVPSIFFRMANIDVGFCQFLIPEFIKACQNQLDRGHNGYIHAFDRSLNIEALRQITDTLTPQQSAAFDTLFLLRSRRFSPGSQIEYSENSDEGQNVRYSVYDKKHQVAFKPHHENAMAEAELQHLRDNRDEYLKELIDLGLKQERIEKELEMA
jgi:hypothetical protein